jgi:cytidylate kinase
MNLRRPVVAIDGPAGAGKSTVTKLVAERLGYLLVDTGALYRTIALAAERRGVAWDDAPAVEALARALVEQRAVELAQGGGGRMQVLLNGEDVSDSIRTQSIGQGASKVSALPGVRAALLDLQRNAGKQGGVVLEGRDIGTVVFPDAEAKFYLTATVDVRAERRHAELRAKGERAEFAEVRDEVIERDRRDSTRPVAPLRQAPDAVVVDSSGLSVAQVVDAIVERVRRVERELCAERPA